MRFGRLRQEGGTRMPAPFEWIVKINKPTFNLSLFVTSYHKPRRCPRYIVIQVLLCCNSSLALPWRWRRARNNLSACVRRTLDPKQRNLPATNQAAETNEFTGPLEQSPMCASWSARALVRLPSVLMGDRHSQLTPPHCSEDALVSERGKLCD